MRVDKATGKRSAQEAAYGKGVRGQVSFSAEQTDGSLAIRSRNFEKKSDADAFRTRTEHELRVGIYVPPEDLNRRFKQRSAGVVGVQAPADGRFPSPLPRCARHLGAAEVVFPQPERDLTPR